jgi:hypothetical protein
MTGLTVDPEPHDNEPTDAAAAQVAGDTPLRSVLIADVAELHAASSGDGPAVMWSVSNQLQTNVVTLPPHGHIGTHGETVLDVTLTVLLGSLTLRHGTDDDDTIAAVVTAPAVVVLPAGTRRSLRAGPAGATYLTAHRARPGLLPTVR